jgi:hypothetical protein
VGALQTIVDTVGPQKNSSLGGNNNGDSAVNFDGMICVEFGLFNTKNISGVEIYLD